MSPLNLVLHEAVVPLDPSAPDTFILEDECRSNVYVAWCAPEWALVVAHILRSPWPKPKWVRLLYAILKVGFGHPFRFCTFPFFLWESFFGIGRPLSKLSNNPNFFCCRYIHSECFGREFYFY